MIALSSQPVRPPSRDSSAPAVARTDPATMAPAARLAELAALLALAALRATRAPTGASSHVGVTPALRARRPARQKGLDVLGGPAPACGHARAPGATGARIATEALPEDNR